MSKAQQQVNEDVEEFEETIELESPTVEEENPDPRAAIAKRHDDKHRPVTLAPEPDPIEEEVSDNTEVIEPSPLVDIKVNGKVIKVEQSRIDKAGSVQAYQKEVAVHQGFQDLAAKQREFDARAAELAQREQRFNEEAQRLPVKDNAKSENSDPPESPGDQKKVQELLRLYRESLLDGDDEAADKAMSEAFAIRDSRDTPIDVNQLETRAVEKAIDQFDQREYSKKLGKDKARFFKSHPEVKTDPRLFDLVDAETELVGRENPEFTPFEIMESAYERVSEWRGVPKNSEAESPSIDEKLNEKRTISRPRASTGKSMPPKAPKAETRSEYVSRLRKERGLET